MVKAFLPSSAVTPLDVISRITGHSGGEVTGTTI